LNITKHYCDKCKKEVLCKEEPTGLIKIRAEFSKPPYGIGVESKEIEVCHACFTELTGVPVRNNGYMDGDKVSCEEANKTVGERLEEIIREVCREEAEEC
jgi:hypothetical protein